MTCRLTDFNVGKWRTIALDSGDVVEIAPATTKLSGMEGLVVRCNGVFLGFTFSDEGAINFAKEWLTNRKKVLH